ncbi:MAG: alpha/beta hydrolase [Microbacteriaceae bacterium]|jgi:pimeloyl-ACP methyl ester carboxylesterase|nr:alpha/beta hydrolase [Microbacteriaceae bacterium]HEV7957381.1 alpha/beta hydrolase [Marisediminicola sp.]
MRRARVAAVSVGLAVVMALTGCVSLFLPEKTTSTPTGEPVSAELEPFYSQVLEWSTCEVNFQCATAEAPMDWNDPGRRTIELALIRSEGGDLGSLLVNPGGPGASGYNLVRDSIDFAVSSTVQAHYDIVGFDPRGVNRSSAVSCYDDPAELDAFLFDVSQNETGSAESIAEIEAQFKAFGQACLEHTGELLGFVDTESAARDLDLLRAVLGDNKLNYLGYSYGTLLGATYAELYPDKTGRLVLDGAVDPATTDFEVSATQAQGFEAALRAFLRDCLTATDCPFTGTLEEAVTDVQALFESLDASPIRATDGRELGRGSMFRAVITPLYSPDNWVYLRDLFTSVMSGDADYAFLLADDYYARSPDGTYSDNSTEAFVSINCLDYRTTSTTESLPVEAAELVRLAPVFGPSMSYGGTGCADWPYQATRERAAIDAAGSAPILVVGTTNDPATPYVWAQNLASQLDSGHLVTYHGEGHTAYNKSNACVNDTVDDYIIDGKVPATDPQC